MDLLLNLLANISAAPDFILYQESGGIGEPSDETVSEAKLKVSNSPVNGYFLSAQSGNTGGLTWAAPIATSCTGNSATATALATARTINGTSFDGTANITVTAAAGTLTGNTLNSSVTASSLTSLGDLAGLTVDGDMSLTGANYNVLWDKSDNALEFADNAKARFGTGNDLQIYHNGSHSYIDDAGTGNLYIRSSQLVLQNAAGDEDLAILTSNGAVKLYFNNSKKFETTSGGASITGNLSFGDNHYAMFGAGNDLQIYHSGTDTFFKNQTGSLNFFNSGVTQFRNAADNETLLKMTSDGSVELYYDNSVKLATTGAGVDINGNLNFDDNEYALFGNSNDLQIYHDGGHSYIHQDGTGSLYILADTFRLNNEANTENIIAGNANGAVELYYDNSKKFETISGGAKITGSLGINTTPSGYYSNNLVLAAGNGGGMTIAASSTSDTNFINFADAANSGGYLMGGILYQHSTNVLAFRSNNAERMRIDSSGNVSIGSTSNVAPLNVRAMTDGNLHVRPITSIHSGTGVGLDVLNDANNAVKDLAIRAATTIFRNASAESMRIDSSGHFLFNCTSLPSSSNAGAAIERNGGTGVFRFSSGSTTASSNAFEFINANGFIGTINLNGSTTSYNSLSDYRLKENVVAISDGITRLKTLKPYRFNFKADADTTVDGFFAHEVTAVPEAITGTKDEVDSDNNPVYQSIDQSKLVPLLVAALQEAVARIEVLEAK